MNSLLMTFTFIFGSMIGSFLNVVIHRVPLGQSIVSPRSSCPKCGKMIDWYENIPILSYLFLRGKCSNCKTHISIRYPLVELVCGLCALFLTPYSLNLNSLLFFFFYFSVFAILLAQFLIDIDHHLLPDSLNLALLVLVVPFTFLNYKWDHWLLGGALGFLFPFLVTWAFYKLRGQIGLGGGDIKLFGILGLLLGLKGIFYNIFISCFLGALVGISLIYFLKHDKNKPIAFGPFIILTAFFQIYLPGYFNSLTKFIFGF